MKKVFLSMLLLLCGIATVSAQGDRMPYVSNFFFKYQTIIPQKG